jgi:hypothetical protein
MVRWSRSVAHALVAPNGVVMTGALGYSAKSHVGRTCPSCCRSSCSIPIRGCAAPRSGCSSSSSRARARTDGRGILDHPCEGQDFAFLPMRPATARIFRPIGAAGLFRWIVLLERQLACGGERGLVRRAFDLFAGKVERHYLPFALANECWSAGEETQELAYSLPTAFDGLGALLRLAELLDPARAARLRGPIETGRAAIRAHLETPVDAGGLRLATPCTRGGVTLAAGWIVQRWVLAKEPPWFGFDLPLIAGHALVHDALSAGAARRGSPTCSPIPTATIASPAPASRRARAGRRASGSGTTRSRRRGWRAQAASTRRTRCSRRWRAGSPT